MRLRRGRLCQGRRTRAPRHKLPVVWAGAIICAILAALPAGRIRFGPRRSSQRSSGPFAPVTKRAQQELSRFVRPAARQDLVGRLLSLREFRGGFALTEQDGAASLALAPAQSARCLEGGEKGVSFAHWRLRSRNSRGTQPAMTQSGVGTCIRRKINSSPHTTKAPRRIPISARRASATAPRRYFSTASRSGLHCRCACRSQ